jgi:hypothetical protein
MANAAIVAIASSTALMAPGSESSNRTGIESVSEKPIPMTAIRIMGLGGRCQLTPAPPGELKEEEDSSTGLLTTDETDLSSESTTSSSKGRSHGDVVRESQPVPKTILDRSGCLKVPTQKLSLALKFGASCSTSSKSLSWNTIEIITHEVILGDNPSVTIGPPLSIGWEVWEKVKLPLEEYEAYRPERRSALGLRMSRSERERLLMQEFGVTRSHIRDVTELINEIRKRRSASAKKTLPEALRDCFNSRRSVLRRNIREMP